MDAKTLLAHHAAGNRRRGVLNDDDTGTSIGAKMYSDDDNTLLQIRAWLPLLGDGAGGWFHAYFDATTGALLASTTGTQDGDAYERAANELTRRGINLN
jgi:hypothetical protein